MSDIESSPPATTSCKGAGGSRIIVALDYAAPADALALASRLDPAHCRVKVGKELFLNGGPDTVQALHRAGFEVFLDLKFHDIPNTVAGACRAAARLGVWMLNVHVSGGRRMLMAAREALGTAPARPLLIGVTLLTSLTGEDLEEVGVNACVPDTVERLARLAADCALDGIVCSARELDQLSGVVPESFLRVTPGIRPTGAARQDQARVMTPAEALAAGAHYLVIGRPITGAADPMAALAAIEADMVIAP